MWNQLQRTLISSLPKSSCLRTSLRFNSSVRDSPNYGPRVNPTNYFKPKKTYSPRSLLYNDTSSAISSSPHQSTQQKLTWEQRGVDPIANWKNMALLRDHMTRLGDIKPARETGVSPSYQRKVARAIKRATSMGLFNFENARPVNHY